MAEFKCCNTDRRWITRPEQRGWLVLGFGFYIITATRQQSLVDVLIPRNIRVEHGFKPCKAIRSLWAVLVDLCQRMFCIRVEVSHYASKVLFEAKREANFHFQFSSIIQTACRRGKETIRDLLKLPKSHEIPTCIECCFFMLLFFLSC